MRRITFMDNQEGRRFVAVDEEVGEDLECLDGPDGCQGKVEYRMPLSPSGRAFPRCDHHWSLRLDKEDASFSWRSDVPPAWFDESLAGERWDDD